MKKIAIYFADLRHNYQGITSTDAMPLGIAYMKSVLDKEKPEVNSELFAYPDELEDRLKKQSPDVLFLTNYMWNENLSLHFAKWTKIANPKTLVVMGGPNFPIEDHRKIDFFDSIYPYVDIYATGEGDFYASYIVKKFMHSDLSIHKLLKEELHSSIYKLNKEKTVVTEILPRIKNLDDIPSPWLSRILDKFFDGKMAPLYETNRGCPFTCTFCVQGTKWYQNINVFSLERIREDIHYIGKKIFEKCPEQKLLRIADPNFGMYNRDVEISSYLGETQKLYNWPLIIDATTGKNRADNIIKSIEQVNGALVMYQAVQSLDDEVLSNIKRDNIKLKSYEDVQIYIRGRGLKSSSDLILGLPGETLKSHLTSLKKLINSGTNRLNNFQSMMLKGAEFESENERQKFGFKTKYRLVPKNLGIYFGEKVFDTDEIIVESKTLSFDDYLVSRKYHFIISLFWNESKFEKVIEYLNLKGFENWDFIQIIYSYLEKDENSKFNILLNSFINETHNELFDSKEDLKRFYENDLNFNRALNSEIGDNLIYKYRALACFWYWEDTCKVVFESIKEKLLELKYDNKNIYVFEDFIEDWKKYMIYSQSFGSNIDELLSEKTVSFNYNIPLWLKEFDDIDFDKYKFKNKQKFRFSISNTNLHNLSGALKIWNYSLKSLPMFVRRIHNSWRERTVNIEY